MQHYCKTHVFEIRVKKDYYLLSDNSIKRFLKERDYSILRPSKTLLSVLFFSNVHPELKFQSLWNSWGCATKMVSVVHIASGATFPFPNKVTSTVCWNPGIRQSILNTVEGSSIMIREHLYATRLMLCVLWYWVLVDLVDRH